MVLPLGTTKPLDKCYFKAVMGKESQSEKEGTGLGVTDGTDLGWGEKQEVTGVHATDLDTGGRHLGAPSTIKTLVLASTILESSL